MIGDLFWSAATSHVVLSALGLVLLAALVVGYAPLLKWFPIIGPYVPAAKLVAFLTFGLLCALVDRRSADARAEIAQLRIDLTFAETQLSNIKATAADKARLADASAAAAASALQKASTYETLYLSKPAAVRGACDDLDDEFAAVLHSIQPRRAVKSERANPAGLRGIGKALFGATR